MRSALLVLVAALSSIASLSCASSDPSSEDTSASDDELTASPPSPFALQFVGAYRPDPGSTSPIARVTLERDGHYTIVFSPSRREHGSWHASKTRTTLPLTFRLVTRGHFTSMQIDAYDQKATVERDGVTTHLHATSTVGPNETICDDSGGSWADDDADPATGLYCVCNAGTSYIPSAGGCVP